MSMADSDSGPVDEIEREIALGKLYTQARRALSQGRVQRAMELAGEASLAAPDATSTEELLGDVAMAQKRYSEARAHYKRALEIEPANIDAERKYGEAVLVLSRSERVRRRVEEVAEDPGKYTRFRKIPWVAAFYSVIPGLGQIYNRQYEKGMALVAAALILLALILSQLVSYSSASLIAESARRSGKLNTERAQQVVDAWGPLTWTLVGLAIAVYLGIWIYSILDAYRTCKREAQEADELGVDL